MIDMMCPLILEADTISTQMLDTIFDQIVEPKKVCYMFFMAGLIILFHFFH